MPSRSNGAARQLRYSEKNDKSLDLMLFLNGIPIFTAELKNLFTGQDVEDATRRRLLVVIFAERPPRTRLISARLATRRERKRYEETGEAS